LRPAGVLSSALSTPARKAVVGALVALLLGAGWAALYVNSLLGARPLAGPVSVTIPPAATSRQVAGLLYQRGLVVSPWVFDVYVRVRHVDGSLKPGIYHFTGGCSVPVLARALVAGPPLVAVTVPGGFTVDQIAARLAAKGLVDRADFLRQAAYGRFDFPFLQGVPPGPGRLEGFLYPDTYRVADGENPAGTVIDLMLRRFNEEAQKLDLAQKAAREGLTLRQAVTVASIVEKEARKNDQRSEVAAVIMNRLALGMPIQSDATVAYAAGCTGVPDAADYQNPSPYNTYLHPGLPPGPIASPGKASLLAAVQPAHDHYLYFLAKPDGTLVFSTTLAEQNANRKRYLEH